MTSLFDLRGKVALITGSSRGIGKAIAEALAAHGARVVISSRNQDACDEVAAALNSTYGKGSALAVAASISNKEQLRALVAKTEEGLGHIDVLVCNAASNPHYGSMLDISDDQFRKIMDNNVLATTWLIQMVAPGMLARHDGSIIIISSIGGMTSSASIGAYNVSKAADFQIARNLAVEFGERRVRVNCIAPGLIRTEFARALWDDPNAAQRIKSLCALGRIGEPEEIAGAAVFLASPSSRYMTGQSIVIDGGSTIMVGL